MKVFRPLQKIMFTDRTYRMYAPDPRSAKRIPFLELKTDLSPIRFLNTPPGGNLGLVPVFAREKWVNFIDHMAKAMEGGEFFYSRKEGEAIFKRLAERICLEESRAGGRVRSVAIGTRKVSYGEFRGDIVWEEPEILESFACP
jgi:hypothetical protein